MKKTLLFTFILSLILTSCLDQETVATTGEDVTIVTTDNTTTNNNNTTTDNTTTGTTTLGTGTTCTGNSTSDGQGNGTPLHQYEIVMAGGQSWVPGIQSTTDLYGDFPSILESGLIFPSDNLLRVRFKVKPQPFVPKGQIYCKGRATGQAGDHFKYTKLKFAMHLRDVICNDFNNNGVCVSAQLGPRYKTQFIDAIDQNTCSPIIDIGHIRNQGPNTIATTVEIDSVRSDSTCQSNGFGCPSEIKVRDASCWQMTMQVVTDFTQDFK